jgi:hypothetical protein
MNASSFRSYPRPAGGMARSLYAMVAALAMLGQATAEDASPAQATGQGSDSSAVTDVSSTPPTNLDPMVVKGPKLPGILGRIFGNTWNVSEVWGDNFHVRSGQLLDAIGFRHDYLQKHPGERAMVVVVTRPVDQRVTQAVVAYTASGKLHIESVAMGDIVPGGLTVADVDRPEVIRKYVEDIRDTYLMDLGFSRRDDGQDLSKGIDLINNPATAPSEIANLGGNQAAAAQSNIAGAEAMAAMQSLTLSGSQLAMAEETGDYSGVVVGGFGEGEPVPLYPGSSADMLTSAYHWLNDMKKVGLIPVARGKVTMDLTHLPEDFDEGNKITTQDAVVFDWDGVHYMYNDQYGTLGMPIPKNPVTGIPYLVIRNGDLLESLYFVATYSKKHPDEKAALVPPVDGTHAAAAFSKAGRIWIMSPFLGRFELPARYRIDDIDAIARLHKTLVARELKNLPPGTASLPGTGLPQAMPGDSSSEQVRRAYLAFTELGIPGSFLENEKKIPGLRVTYHGSDYSYFAPD